MCCSLGLFIQHPVQICPPSTNTTDEPLVHDDPKCFLFSEHPQKVLAWTVGIAAQVHTAQDYEIILQKPSQLYLQLCYDHSQYINAVRRVAA